MRSYVINGLALIFAMALFVFFEFGVIAPQNAVFGAIALVAAYTGYQLAMREGSTFYTAFRAMFAEPSSYPRVTAYLSYLVSVSIGLMIFAQALILTA